MTPADRAALIARAKALAGPVAACVAGDVSPDMLLADCTWDDLAALVVVLAESVSGVRLRAVVAADDDGDVPSPGVRELVLRRAHAEVRRFRVQNPGCGLPARLSLLESEYQRGAYRRKLERTAAKAA